LCKIASKADQQLVFKLQAIFVLKYENSSQGQRPRSNVTKSTHS